MGTNKVRFSNATAGDFSTTLKQRVEAYFQDNKISKKANLEMFLKTAFYLGGYLALYAFIIFSHQRLTICLGLAVFLGFFTAGIGFNIGHDALHGAYSKRKWLNALMGHSFTMMGANVFTWNITHNIVHHSYTNIPEADGDLHPVSWLKFFATDPRSRSHRYQHLYGPILYCLTSLVWVFSKDYVHIRKRKFLFYEKDLTPKKEIFYLIGFKSLYYFAFLFVPWLLMPIAWWQVAIGFIAMHFAAGFTLALTFQLGHLVEGTKFPNLSSDGSVSDTWSVHQLRTSANFSTNSLWASWIFGGLNYQIEHHLFPKICHVHYRRIARIVEHTAAEYSLPYTRFPTFLSAVRSHFRYLRNVGASP